MKKLLLSILLLVGISAFSQTINGIDLRSFPNTSFEIIGEIPLKSAISLELKNIAFNFGSKDKRLMTKDFIVKDEAGDKVEFITMIDALSFFEKRGYKLQETHICYVEKINRVFHHYILKKSK